MEKMANDKLFIRSGIDMQKKYSQLFSFFDPTLKANGKTRTRRVPQIKIPIQSLFEISPPPSSDLEPSQQLDMATTSARCCSDSIGVTTVGFEREITFLSSLRKPKKILMKGDDGRTYPMLLKREDDLRIDKRFIEFNKVVNTCLRQDREARRRQLYIRSYHVTPLREKGGIIEWVNDLIPLGDALEPLLIKTADGKSTNLSVDVGNFLCWDDETKIEKYKSWLLAKHPPMMAKWFAQSFTDPCGWYAARLAFTRTTAVMNMVGFVAGLGDRHDTNLLIDKRSGDVVHVDFTCLFDAGEFFDVPERVPFRLTHNIIDGFGPLRIEGPYRRACETTLSVLRRNHQMLLSVLYTIAYDPVYLMETYRKKSGQAPQPDVLNVVMKRLAAGHQQLAEPITCSSIADPNYQQELHIAQEMVDFVSKRISGQIATRRFHIPRCSFPICHSMQGQVEQLIKMATDDENLAVMHKSFANYI